MSEEEREVLKTFKKGLGLTSAEREILVNYIEKLQKKNEQSQEILSSIKIIYMVHTKDCELTLKDIKKWEKILDK